MQLSLFPRRGSISMNLMSAALLLATSLACASVKPRSNSGALPVVELRTDAGIIHLQIDSVRAPQTSANFLRYVDRGLYDGAAFGRTVSAANETAFHLDLLQADRPTNPTPPDDPPVLLERTSTTKIVHVEGTLSMAREKAPQSATSSFFICLEQEPSLDFGGGASGDGQGYGAFGRVIRGMDVVKAIHDGPANGQKLITPIHIISARRLGGRS